MRRAAIVLGAALAACLAASAEAAVAEAPPAQGTRLHFQKTLFIQSSPNGRVFAESRRSDQDTSLRRILAEDYGVPEEAAGPLVEAFRALNPGTDPDKIGAGQVVRIPFKIEDSPTSAKPSAPQLPTNHTVRRGESLWRILKNHYRVSREAMPQALAAISRANAGIRDLNHLLVGQKISIPSSITGTAGPAATPTSALAPPRTLTKLLEQLGCSVATSGEVFLPLSRARTVRLDAKEFPIITGPSGRRVVLDASSRLSAALTRALEESWNYSVLQGAEPSVEVLLQQLLPRLGLHQVTEGPARLVAAPGVELLVDTRWTVVPREEDLWEGQVQLLFSSGSPLDPGLMALALKAGYSVHLLAGDPAAADPGAGKGSLHVPELSMSDPAKGQAALLDRLGIPCRVRPDVEIDLGSGVRYHLRPEVTFEHAGTSYAVPPQEPRRAESLLARAGYFTIPLSEASSPMDRLRDLLSLLGPVPTRVAVEAPKGERMRLRVEGLVFDSKTLADRLYPGVAVPPGARPLLTLASVSPEAADVLLREGFLPWVVRAPDPPASGPSR